MKKVWILMFKEYHGSYEYVHIARVFDGEPSIPGLQNVLIALNQSGEVINEAIEAYRDMLDGKSPYEDMLVFNEEGDIFYFDIQEVYQ